MYEEVVVVVPLQQLRSAVQQPGTLVPDHLPGLEDDLVTGPAVVQDEQRPLLPNGLANVQYGRDDVSLELVYVSDQPGPVSVSPDAVRAGVLQPHSSPGLRQRLQASLQPPQQTRTGRRHQLQQRLRATSPQVDHESPSVLSSKALPVSLLLALRVPDCLAVDDALHSQSKTDTFTLFLYRNTRLLLH